MSKDTYIVFGFQYEVEDAAAQDLLLKGRHGLTMIAEIPSPRRVGRDGPFQAGIKKARRECNAHWRWPLPG